MEIMLIDESRKADINIKNEPFPLRGRLKVCFDGENWSASPVFYETAAEMRFPDEGYDYGALRAECEFLGAYQNGECAGLAILKDAPFSYMLLHDLKVRAASRRLGAGRKLVSASLIAAKKRGYGGIYAVCQDNNLDACLFYLSVGFRIGGLDTEVYSGTNQAGKSDICFYLDA